MPLLDTDRPLYLRRERVFVDSHARDEARSRDEFTVSVPLPRAVENVQAIELVDYNVPRDIAPTFVASRPGVPGNNLLDVQMERAGTGHTLEFTVELDTDTRYSSYEALVESVADQISDAMDAQGDAYFATSNDVVVKRADNVAEVTTGAEMGFVHIYIEHETAPEQLNLRFLFGSGPSRGKGPELVLGFDEGEDTLVVDAGTDFFGTGPIVEMRAYKIAALTPFRYVDVFVEEARGALGYSTPLARIPLVDESYLRAGTRTDRPRLLSRPIRRLDRLSVSLRLQGDRLPSASTSHDGWDLVFDLLVLAKRPEVPGWTAAHTLALD
jgi:hypothetical protein